MQEVPLPGSLVWLRQRRWRVVRTRVDRRALRLDVAGHATRLTVIAPFDRPRLLARPRRTIHVRRQRARARLAALVTTSPPARLAAAAVTARIRLWPYQVEPLLAVLDGQRRLLIADDAGLGKTIQAGLILAEIQRRDPAAAALVVVPASLRQQWADELRTRFSLPVREMDLGPGGADTAPWPLAGPSLPPGVCLASLDYLKQPHVLDGIPACAWDVVVIDEAHMATGRTDRHGLCDELGRRARHLVLLTATPHDGNASRFARLMRLGVLPFDGDTLAVFRRTRAAVALPHPRVVRWHHLPASAGLRDVLDALAGFEHSVLAAARPATRDASLLLLSVFRKRALSTLSALDRTLARRLEWLESSPAQPRPDWAQPGFDFGVDDPDGEEGEPVAVDVSLPRARERAWLRRIRTLVAACRGRDPKLTYVRELATRAPEPFVLFTEFRHSLERAYTVLAPLRAVAVLHGGQSESIRRDELTRFLSGAATVLIATDVGSQGLNLQHRARWMINLELPWNPSRLEQRVGRLDRIGQRCRVHVTMLVTDHPAENTLLASMGRRTLEARRWLGPQTLADATPPPHLAVASALIEGTTWTGATFLPTHLETSTEYRRAGRAQVVVAQRRRRLGRWWQGGSAIGARPVHSTLGRAPAGRRVRAIAVVSTLLLDRSGDLVERRLMALALEDEAQAGEVRSAIEQALPRLQPRIERRLCRLQQLLSSAANRRLDAERAIALHLHAVAHPGQTQLGLFSQRAARIHQDARARAAFGATAAARRLRLADDRRHLTSTPLVVEWLAERR